MVQMLIDSEPAEIVRALVRQGEDGITEKHIQSMLTGIVRMVKGNRIGYASVSSILSACLRDRKLANADRDARSAARGLLGMSLLAEVFVSSSVAGWRRWLEGACTEDADQATRVIGSSILEALSDDGSAYRESFPFTYSPAADEIGWVIR